MCGGRILLAKHWGSGPWEAYTGSHILWDRSWSMLKPVSHNEFFVQHIHCQSTSAVPENHFEIGYEVEDESKKRKAVERR